MKRKEGRKVDEAVRCMDGYLSHEVSVLAHFLGSTLSVWAHRTTPRRQPPSVAWGGEREVGEARGGKWGGGGGG